MKEICLPYDTGTQTVHVPEQNLAGVLVSHQASYQAQKSGAELVEDSLDHPIGSPCLEELAKGKKNIVIISSDHTRPVNGGILIDFVVPYEDIAGFCGISTRNSVNRLISQLREDGLLELQDHHILIPSLERLQEQIAE